MLCGMLSYHGTGVGVGGDNIVGTGTSSRRKEYEFRDGNPVREKTEGKEEDRSEAPCRLM